MYTECTLPQGHGGDCCLENEVQFSFFLSWNSWIFFKIVTHCHLPPVSQPNFLLYLTEFQAEVHKPTQVALLKNSCQTHSQHRLLYFYWIEQICGAEALLSAVLMLFKADLLVAQCLHISDSMLLSVRCQSFTFSQFIYIMQR